MPCFSQSHITFFKNSPLQPLWRTYGAPDALNICRHSKAIQLQSNTVGFLGLLSYIFKGSMNPPLVWIRVDNDLYLVFCNSYEWLTPWVFRAFSLHRMQGILSGSLQWSSKLHRALGGYAHHLLSSQYWCKWQGVMCIWVYAVWYIGKCTLQVFPI